MNKLFSRTVRIVLGLMLLYAAGLGVRRAVFHAQVRAAGRELPFTLESALNFRRIQQVYEQGNLPTVDPFVQYPEGVTVREHDTVGAERVYAALARLFPARVPLADRVRWIEAAWFSLGIPLMALWVGWWRKSVWAGAVAGAFYAVALSSVIRSTGQEVSHENFALPLLVGHFAFGALSARLSSRRTALAASLFSALLLGLALMTWDLIQFYVLLWAVWSAWRVVFGRAPDEPGDRVNWLLQWLVLVGVGLFNPYLRTHGFLQSPAMQLTYGTLLAAALSRFAGWGYGARWTRRAVLGAVVLAPLAVGLLLPAVYGESYGHFASLLWAKIRFLNHKPADPGRLTFDQRIMWVPALDSATGRLTIRMFPAMLWLSVAAFPVFLYRSNNQSDSKLSQLLFFGAASLVAFVLFVRFHVFAAVFLSALLGAWAAWAGGRKGWRWVVPGMLMIGWAVEAGQVLRRPERWGRVAYFAELDELAGWLRRYASPEPVLANFGTSAFIAAYGDCPVILQPKFETRGIRDRVRSYGTELFKGSEDSFRDWAGHFGAQYYVYGLGEFAPVAPELQMRYFVNALEPATNCPAQFFENAPARLRSFRLLWENRKYRVFKIATPEDRQVAGRFGAAAERALQSGDLGRAEDRAVAALLVEPDNRTVQDILKHVGSLKDQGFKAAEDESR